MCENDFNGHKSFFFFLTQVFRIRGELRKRKMQYVSVERVFNVQGIELVLFIYYFFIQSGGK